MSLTLEAPEVEVTEPPETPELLHAVHFDDKICNSRTDNPVIALCGVEMNPWDERPEDPTWPKCEYCWATITVCARCRRLMIG